MILQESRFQWIDTLFDWCVQTIKDFGQAFDMTYNEANILIFCIVWPLLFIYFMALALLNAHYKSKWTSQWFSEDIANLEPITFAKKTDK